MIGYTEYTENITTSKSCTVAPVTGIILNYNYVLYLADAIDSLLNQHIPFQEVIVVNDGSTDDSMDVIRKYGDRIAFLDIENRGQTGASIAGLELVNSEYVYFLDADDFAEPDLTKQLLPFLKIGAAKIQFQLQGVDADRQPLSSVFPTFPAGYNAEHMRRDNQIVGFYICPPTSGNIYRVSTLRSLPLSRLNYRDPFDGSPALVMPYVGEVASVSLILANYRVHGSNLSLFFHPTPENLAREMDRLRRHWREAAMLVPNLTQPQIESTLLALDGLLASSALLDKTTPSLVFRYIRALFRSNETARRKILLTLWALLLLILPRDLRRRLVYAKRSPVNRSSRIRALVKLLLGT